ncbi:zinc ABC transporter substrate-binding protein [Enemella dayhoffiae]|uniref:Zinc ABC transporter substrate-binding protein n=1 Tax=Enemella dayhoffiae TaxID=2016507 RepID=A0A255GN26_9ACTN|nr:metal ABC transporter substrate-binding protein [Enemella dayhoffiae]OYO17230.1 zinc ABC transporter substrate-binding protein [Enemella dayhoffiae]
MRKPHHLLGSLLLTSVLLLAGCGGGSADPGKAQPGQLKVVVAFYPFQYAAERVGGASAKVTNLTQPGSEPHDLELTPRQVASLSDADVVVYQKGFQPAVDRAIEQARPKRALDLATVVTLAPQAGGDDGHGHDHGHGEANDPHAWLDPTNMVKISQAVSRELSAAKPEQGTTFAQNAQTVETELTNLDREFQTGLANCRRKEFITSHAAFGYLANRYRLTQIGIRDLSPDEEPSPARVASVQQEARQHGVTTIFYETLVSPEVAKAVAGDLGLKVDVLDPLEGLTKDSRGTNYIEVMKSNLNSLKAANECN